MGRGQKVAEAAQPQAQAGPAGPPAGLVVLAALALCAPFLPALLEGRISTEAAALRFLAALLLSWAACGFVLWLMHRYAAPPEAGTEGDVNPRRRREDRVSTPE